MGCPPDASLVNGPTMVHGILDVKSATSACHGGAIHFSFAKSWVMESEHHETCFKFVAAYVIFVCLPGGHPPELHSVGVSFYVAGQPADDLMSEPVLHLRSLRMIQLIYHRLAELLLGHIDPLLA